MSCMNNVIYSYGWDGWFVLLLIRSKSDVLESCFSFLNIFGDFVYFEYVLLLVI